MLYKFRSKAAGDVIMLGPQGEQLLRLLGREPEAKGIFEPAAMPGLIAALEGAITKAEARASGARADDDETPAESPVTLRQRLWPMIELLRRSMAAGVPVVWGV